MKKNVSVILLFAIIAALEYFQTVQGQKNNPRIISGTPAASGQFPWQVIIKKDEYDDLHCGGSVIYDKWVLTAAHCTYGLTSLYLIFGSIKLENPDAVSMTATSFFIHPNYNNANLNNDVSLILLPTTLQFTDVIKPIPLVPNSLQNNNFIGVKAIIAGFGLTDDEYLDFSQNLLFAQVVIIANSQCVSIFGDQVVISSTLCARGVDGIQSICSGDSGGPLIARDSNGNFMQIGINSFVAEDNCSKGYPSGYVRLTSFLDFISQTTGVALS